MIVKISARRELSAKPGNREAEKSSDVNAVLVFCVVMIVCLDVARMLTVL